MAFNENMGITKEHYEELRSQPSYVGKVGDRMAITSVITSYAGAMTDWGYVFYYTLQDKNRNQYFYRGTVELGRIGQGITINATIKQQQIRLGRKTNIISHPVKLAKS